MLQVQLRFSEAGARILACHAKDSWSSRVCQMTEQTTVTSGEGVN